MIENDFYGEGIEQYRRYEMSERAKSRLEKSNWYWWYAIRNCERNWAGKSVLSKLSEVLQIYYRKHRQGRMAKWGRTKQGLINYAQIRPCDQRVEVDAKKDMLNNWDWKKWNISDISFEQMIKLWTISKKQAGKMQILDLSGEEFHTAIWWVVILKDNHNAEIYGLDWDVSVY